MAAGAGVWVKPWIDRGADRGWRVFFRLEPRGKLRAVTGPDGLGRAGRRFAMGPEGKAEADKFAATLKARINMRNRSVGGAIDEFETEQKARGNVAETVRQTAQRLRVFLAPVLGAPLSTLTFDRSKELYRSLATDGRDGKSYAVGTHQKMLRTAREFGDWLVKDQKWLSVNPFENIKPLGTANAGGDWLRPSEARAFADAAFKAYGETGDEGAAQALITLYQSPSPHELVGIEARDIDENGALLVIEGRRVATGGRRLKAENRRRELTICSARLRALLLQLKEGKAATDRVFSSDRDNGTDAAKRIGADVLGRDDVDSRMLRRTCLNNKRRRGAGLDDTAFLAGHGADAAGRTAKRSYLEAGTDANAGADDLARLLDGTSYHLPKPRGRHAAPARLPFPFTPNNENGAASASQGAYAHPWRTGDHFDARRPARDRRRP